MADGPVLRHGEPPLLAFISSVMDEEFDSARSCVEEVLGAAPFLLPWAFEHTPASGQDVQVAYLEKVRRSVFVFWLVGSRTTDPVIKEVQEALAAGRRLIVLLLPAETRDEATMALLEQVRPRVKYRELRSLDELPAEVDLAVSDEINRALQELPGMSRVARLDELGRASRARCIERWQVAGVEETLALALAQDMTVGGAPEDSLPGEERPFRVLQAEMGVGKSLAGERFHQAAIAVQLTDTTAPVPVYLRARDAGENLEGTVVELCEGLGDPRQQGASLVLDGIDEAGGGAAAKLFEQARVLARTWPGSRVLLTSRPLSVIEDAEELACLPALDLPVAAELVGRVAGVDVTLGWQAGWPENIRQAVQIPLFAVLLGSYLRRHGGAVPGSRGELLRSLVEQAVGRVEGDVKPMLRKLAVLSLGRGGGPVPEGEVLGTEDPARLEETRLVVRRERTLVYPLIVLAQWFAAESLIDGDPAPEQLAADAGRLEVWRYPLAIAIGIYGYQQVSALLGPLAATHAGFASQVVEEGLAKWSQAEEVTAPSALDCAQQVRDASEQWVEGAASLKDLFWPVVRDGQLAPTGAHVNGAWLTTGFYVGDEQIPDVNELPQGWQAAVFTPADTALKDWVNIHGARPGRQAAWAWRWSFEQLRSALEGQLQARMLRLIDGPLADAEVWGSVCTLNGLSFMHDQPIAIAPTADAIPEDAEIMIFGPGRRILTRGVGRALRAKLTAGVEELTPPFPGPDLLPGGWVWSAWGEQRLLERTRAVYAAAIEGYEALTAGQFSSLAPWMQTAVTLPAVLHGYLNPGHPAGGFESRPLISWWLEALPAGETSRVELKIQNEDRREEEHAEFEHHAQTTRTRRPQHSAWLDSTSHSSILDVFTLFSAQELVYHWLWNDLKRIRWVEKNLGQQPNRWRHRPS
jgi:hypothetical protein